MRQVRTAEATAAGPWLGLGLASGDRPFSAS